VAWREGAGLVGVVIASALPVMAGWRSTTAFLGLMLLLGLLVWSRVLLQTRIDKDSDTELTDKDNYLPLKQISFRKLLWVFLLNGIASAVPAGLVMFFIEDQIQASAAMSPLFFVRRTFSALMAQACEITRFSKGLVCRHDFGHPEFWQRWFFRAW
jgi:Na+/melibiose symporter-like transporter